MDEHIRTGILCLCFLLLGCCVDAQDASSPGHLCPCNETSTIAGWGPWMGEAFCVGQCDAAQQFRFRLCYESGVQRTCALGRPGVCEDADSCQGLWSAWANVGNCNSECGTGERPQSRTCYKKGDSRNLRNNNCLGGSGAYEQNRTLPCSSRRNCQPISSTTSSTPNTSTLGTSSSSTTSTSTQQPSSTSVSTDDTITPSLGDDGDTRIFPIDPPQFPIPIPDEFSPPEEAPQTPDSSDPATPPPPTEPESEIDTVVLAAVLGSVALVCITVVAVAVAVVMSKRKRVTPVNDYNSNTTNVTAVSHGIRNENYEMVEPAGRVYENNLDSPQSVSNTLYQPMSINGDIQVASTSDYLYLQPIPSPAQPAASETIYFSIDDTKR